MKKQDKKFKVSESNPPILAVALSRFMHTYVPADIPTYLPTYLSYINTEEAERKVKEEAILKKRAVRSLLGSAYFDEEDGEQEEEEGKYIRELEY